MPSVTSTSRSGVQSRAVRFAGLAVALALLFVAQRALPAHAQTSTVAVTLTATPTNPSAGQTVTFTAVIPTGGSNFTYVWSFGDPNSGSQNSFTQSAAPNVATATHTYAASGTYAVSVVAFQQVNNAYVTGTGTLSLTVGGAGTTTGGTNTNIQVAANGPYSGTAGHPISFGGYAYSCGTCPAITTYSWNFGDGTGAVAGQYPQHTYTNPGTYTATVTATDAAGGTNSASTQVTVGGTATGGSTNGGTTTSGAGQASANGVTVNTGGPYTGASGATISFSGSATTTNANATIVSYVWSFGDGQSGSGQTTTHSYNSSGTFTVVLTATDSTGVAVSASTQATVQAGARKINLLSGCTNVASTFPDATSTGSIAQAVSPSSAVLSIWEFDPAAGRFHGYLPGATQASDLPTVNRLDAIFICVNAAATFTEPSI